VGASAAEFSGVGRLPAVPIIPLAGSIRAPLYNPILTSVPVLSVLDPLQSQVIAAMAPIPAVAAPAVVQPAPGVFSALRQGGAQIVRAVAADARGGGLSPQAASNAFFSGSKSGASFSGGGNRGSGGGYIKNDEGVLIG